MIAFLAAITLAPAATFHFAGGSDVELVRTIAAHTALPIAIVSEGGRVWQESTFEYEAEKALWPALASRLGLNLLRGDNSVVSPAWPKFIYLGGQRHTYVASFENGQYSSAMQRPELTISNGIVSARTPFAPARLADLLPLGMKKPVRWHWFFDEMRLALSVTKSSEEQYLVCIASALGAIRKETNEGVFFDLDPREYRRRGIALLASLARTPSFKFLAIDAEFTAAALQVLTDQQITAALKEPTGSIVVDQPDPIFQAAARRRMRIMFGLDQGDQQGPPQLAGLWGTMSKQADFDKPCQIVFDSQGLARSRYPAKPGGLPVTF